MKPMRAFSITDNKELEAKHADYRSLRYPAWRSIKLDGIRAVYEQGVFKSNSLKVFQNKVIQDRALQLQHFGALNLDGEWVYGDPAAEDVFNKTQSVVMSHNPWEIPWFRPSELRFYVFDTYKRTVAFMDIVAPLTHQIQKLQDPQGASLFWLVNWIGDVVESADEFIMQYTLAVEAGFEGLMYRILNGRYKDGRSTANEGYIGKMKPYGKELFEATIVGVEPMTSWEAPYRDELGFLKHHRRKDTGTEVEAIGSFLVKDHETGAVFSIGSGKFFTMKMRTDGWKVRDSFMGKVVQYKRLNYGAKDKPRSGTAYAVRERHVDDIPLQEISNA